MQPEEIIQQKEWHQLSSEERKILEPLAADEQEFNLLKKMLLVADEAGADVPAIAPAIQEKLSRSVKYIHSGRKIWYAAAAVIFVFVTGGIFFYTHTANHNNKIVRINPPLKKVIIKDSVPPNQPIVQDKEIKQPVTVKKTIQDKPAPAPSDPGITIPDHKEDAVYVYTRTRIKDDTELMSLITEVY